MKKITFRDVEQFSAHLDGKLSQADSARLESRLQTDPNLRAVMDDLSQSRALLRKLPARRAPRNFTLTPKMAGVKPPLPRAYPTLRLATALATLLLFFSFATNALAPSLSSSAPMAAFGMGGGGPETDSQLCQDCSGAPAAAATEPPATEAPALAAPSSEPVPAPTELVAPETTQKAQLPDQSAAPVVAPRIPASAPIPLSWQIGLLIVALACGGMAWILRSNSDSSWRGKPK